MIMGARWLSGGGAQIRLRYGVNKYTCILPPGPDSYVNVEEAARLMEVSRATMYVWVKAGKVTKYPGKGSGAFQLSELYAMAQARRIV